MVYIQQVIINSDLLPSLCTLLPSLSNPNPNMETAVDGMYVISSLMQKGDTDAQDVFRDSHGVQQILSLLSSKESAKVR